VNSGASMFRRGISRLSLRQLFYVLTVCAVVCALASYFWPRPPIVLVITSSVSGLDVYVDNLRVGRTPVKLTQRQAESWFPELPLSDHLSPAEIEVHPAGRILGSKHGRLLWLQGTPEVMQDFHTVETPWGLGISMLTSGVAEREINFEPRMKRDPRAHPIRQWHFRDCCRMNATCDVFIDMDRKAADELGDKVVANISIRRFNERLSQDLNGSFVAWSDSALGPNNRTLQIRIPCPTLAGDYCAQVQIGSLDKNEQLVVEGFDTLLLRK
jgi:hypothetical protein